MTRKFIAYLVAVVITYLVGVVLVSQFNISAIVDMGFSVSFDQRRAAMIHDLVGMLSTYLPLISLALLLAFIFTGAVLSRVISRSTMLFMLAGFVGITAMHLIMVSVLGVTGIAPTRNILGLLAQGCAGAIGGYGYFLITKYRH